jgi:hypothetical protein
MRERELGSVVLLVEVRCGAANWEVRWLGGKIMYQLIVSYLLMTHCMAIAPRDDSAEAPKSAGVLVLDNCDPEYQGKVKFEDNLTLFDLKGNQVFRIPEFNNCESIGSSHMIATDSRRGSIWVIENAANRIRRFDLFGKEELTIHGVSGSALAVDLETGNIWALVGGRIGAGKTIVFDRSGKEIGTHPISGWDIVYDAKAKSFWIAEQRLTKITAATGAVQFSNEVATWCASSVDIDPNSGAVWVAVRQYSAGMGIDRLVKFGAHGKELQSVPLGNSPSRVSVDPISGNVWVATFGKSLELFTNDGKRRDKFPLEALTVQADPFGSDAWVVTPTNLLRVNMHGEIMKRASHVKRTSQAWISAIP